MVAPPAVVVIVLLLVCVVLSMFVIFMLRIAVELRVSMLTMKNFIVSQARNERKKVTAVPQPANNDQVTTLDLKFPKGGEKLRDS